MIEGGRFFGALESGEHFAANKVGVVEGFEAGRYAAPFLVTEVVVLNAGGEDEEIVGQLVLLQVDEAAGGVDAGDFVLEHFDIALPAEDGAQRTGDLVGGEQAGGHLIQHRTKEMVVALVDQRDADRSTRESASREETAEAASHDDYARAGCDHVQPPPSSTIVTGAARPVISASRNAGIAAEGGAIGYAADSRVPQERVVTWCFRGRARARA